MKHWLLHFQESVASVGGRSPDPVANASTAATIERQQILAGTGTVTEVRAEAPDADPNIRKQGGRAMPV